MSDDLQTVNPDQVPVVGAFAPNTFVFIQTEGGPIQRVPYDLLLAKLIRTDLVFANEAAAQAELDYDEDIVALIDNDPDPLKCGWWRKSGAYGAGEWVQFETLAKAVRTSAATLRDEAAGFSESLEDRVKVLASPGGPYQTLFGTLGGPLSAGISPAGVWDFLLGIATLTLAGTDGTLFGAIEVKFDNGDWVISAHDRATNRLLFGLHRKYGMWSYEGKLALDTGEDTSGGSGGTPLAAPLPRIENAHRLRGWRSGCQILKDGGKALVAFNKGIDSWYDGRAYGGANLTERFLLESNLPSAGPGLIGLSSATQRGYAHGSADGLANVWRDGNWTDLFTSADLAVGAPQNFPGLGAMQATVNNALVTITHPAIVDLYDPDAEVPGLVRLFCGKGGAVSYSWDGGASWTALAIAGGAGSTAIDIPLPGAAATQLWLRASLNTKVSSVYMLTSDSGIIFNNMASGGSTVAQWASVQGNADYRAMIALVEADTVTWDIEGGLNDAKGAATIAQVVDGYAQIRDCCRTVNPKCDVLYSAQPDTAQNNAFAMHDLSPELRQAARDNDCAFGDLQDDLGPVGDPITYAAYAYGSARPLLDAENRHPNYYTPENGLIINGANQVTLHKLDILLSAVKG